MMTNHGSSRKIEAGKLLCACCAMCLFAVQAEVTLTGARAITSTTTISEKVTGSGYFVVADGATLTLSGADNDFTGGVIVSNGVLEATASGAFGTGPISLESTAAMRTVKFNAVSGVFANAITVKDAGTGSSNPALYVVQSATLNADVTLDQTMANASAAYVYIKVGADTAATSTKLTLNGKMLAGAGRVYVKGFGILAFKQKVTCSTMYLGSTYNEHGSVELWSSENEISALVQNHFDIKCCDDYVINKTSHQQNFNKQWGHAGYCTTHLQGHSMHYLYFNIGGDCDLDFSASEKWGEMIYNGNGYKPVTLLFDAEGKANCSGRCCTRFWGAINFKMENRMTSGGTFYQAFEGRDNSDMIGSISIGNKCQFRIFNGCRFGGVTNLTIESGGFITYEKRTGKTTPIGNTFTGLRDLYLKGTAFIRSETDELVNPVNSTDCILHMDEDARIYLRKDQVMTVKKLYIGDKYMPSGTYTKDDLRQLRRYDAAASESLYTGSLVVLHGYAPLTVIVR